MLQTGEYATYKEFGIDLIQKLDEEGFTKAIQNKELPKSKFLETPQGIILKYYGFKATASITKSRLKRTSYDCLIQYRDEDVKFETICQEIIRKCLETKNEVSLVKNVIYIFLKTIAKHPLTSINIILKDYFIYDGKLSKISEAKMNNFNYEVIERGVNSLKVVLLELDSIGKYTFQELINIISYIAVIEELNYPKIIGSKNYKGRVHCFGRYVEVLFGNEKELKRLVKSNAFNNGALFIHKKELEEWYFTNEIEKDRIELDNNKNYC